jgi:hypothetical protein
MDERPGPSAREILVNHDASALKPHYTLPIAGTSKKRRNSAAVVKRKTDGTYTD